MGGVRTHSIRGEIDCFSAVRDPSSTCQDRGENMSVQVCWLELEKVLIYWFLGVCFLIRKLYDLLKIREDYVTSKV